MTKWYKLRCVGLSDSYIRKLLGVTKNYEEIKKINTVQLEKNLKFTDKEIKLLKEAENISLEDEMKILEAQSIKLLFIEDEEYPENLRNIGLPPIFLYYKGDINLLNGLILGIVGTRRATVYGKQVCEEITKGLIEAGVTIVSGLAYGIDSICHKKILTLGGKTISVVGSGLDVVYPVENKKLWEEIGEKGLIISEYPLGTPPYQYNFPMRNRIITGISKGIVIIESREKGGSLITAQLALEEGRDIFAVPGEIYSQTSVGCNNLIKNSQAKLVTSVKDILEEYGIDSEIKEGKLNVSLTNEEKEIYNLIINSKSIDEIVDESKFKIQEVLAILIDLEIKNLVVAVPGGGYRKRQVR